MKDKLTFSTLLLLALFLVLGRNAQASSTWYVNGVNGSDSNNCKSSTTPCLTIGHAIALASSGDSIRVAGATYTEGLDIGISLKLIGSGATTTIIDGGRYHRVVTVSNAGAKVTLSNVTIRNGRASVNCIFFFCSGNPSGAGVFNKGTLTINSAIISGNTAYGGCWYYYGRPFCFNPSGAGVFNKGTLTINSAIISSNTASAYCAFQLQFFGCGASGGGIANSSGTLTISNSTLSGNSVQYGGNGCAFQFRLFGCYASGGGIANGGTLIISNSTISWNSVQLGGNGVGGTAGGGIDNSGIVAINNSTIAGNFAQPGTNNFSYGGGIYNSRIAMISNSTISGNSEGVYSGAGTATLQNSIVADSSSNGNCGGAITSNGYNMSSDDSCSFSFRNSGDRNNIDPLLGTLGYYGGTTQTIPLRSRSPAIDAGNPSGCTDGKGKLLTTDQRGMPRPDKDEKKGCDMGAYELQAE